MSFNGQISAHTMTVRSYDYRFPFFHPIHIITTLFTATIISTLENLKKNIALYFESNVLFQWYYNFSRFCHPFLYLKMYFKSKTLWSRPSPHTYLPR